MEGHSLIDFQENAGRYLRQVIERGAPISIALNGESRVVLQDARSYEAMVGELEQGRLARALIEGEEDIKMGRTKSLESVFEELSREYGLEG